jgi:O-antigen ligase
MNSTYSAHRGATGVLPSAWPVAAAGLLGSLLVGVLLARNTTLGVAAAVGACYAPVAFMNLPIGIVLWIPLAFLNHAAVAGPAPTLMMIILGAAWIGALPTARGAVSAVFRRHAAMFTLMLGLLAWTTASLIWAEDLGAAASNFWWWWIAGAVLTVVTTTIDSRRFAVIACWAVVAGALLSLAVAVAQGTDSSAALATQDEGRLGTSGPQDPNYLAAALVPAGVLAAGLAALTRPGVWRVGLIGIIAALAIGLLATGSRGGLVAAVVAVAAALALARGRRLQIGALVALAVVVVGGWVFASSPDTIDRVKTFESGTGRVDLWSVALRMSGDNPVVGVGIDNFQSRSIDYVLQPGQLENAELIVDTPHVVHNVYLQQLAETGVVGLALLLGFFGAALAATASAARRFREVGDRAMEGLASAVLVAQIAALSASVFLSNGYDLPLWILLALGPPLVTVATRAQGTVSR